MRVPFPFAQREFKDALRHKGRVPRNPNRSALAADGAVIEVEDDGPGISEADKQSMLKPFVRGDSARNMDDAAGFGLGLSIAQAIVLAHGGELSLLDRSPRGLLVRVALPAHAPSRRSAA